MGLFGNLEHWAQHRWGDGPSWSGLESSVKGTGKFAGQVGQYAAPIVSIANPLLGAGIAAASAGLRGKSVQDMLKDAAITGASGFALGKAGSFFGGAGDGAADATNTVRAASAEPGVVESMPYGAEASAVMGGAPTSAAATSAAAGAGGAAGGDHGFFSSAIDAIKHHPGPVLDAAGRGLTAAAQYSGDNARNHIAQGQLDFERQQYEETQRQQRNRAQLLAALLQKMGMPNSVAADPYLTQPGAAQ